MSKREGYNSVSYLEGSLDQKSHSESSINSDSIQDCYSQLDKSDEADDVYFEEPSESEKESASSNLKEKIIFLEEPKASTNIQMNSFIQKQKCKERLIQLIQQKKKQLTPKQQNRGMHQRFQRKLNLSQKDLLNSSEKLKSFLSRIGELKNSSIQSTALAQYSMLLPSKLNSKINCVILESYVKQKNQKIFQSRQKEQGWDMLGYFCLLWILCKMIEHKQALGKMDVLQLTHQDYQELQQIFLNSNPNCIEVVEMFRKKKYTDRWTSKQSELLQKIGTKYKVEQGNMDFTQIAKKLKLQNHSPLAPYRCWTQCQRQWNRLTLSRRTWTSEQDNRILRLIDKAQSTKLDWKDCQKHFQNRTDMAIKSRTYTLLSKLRGILPDTKITNLQLVTYKLQGRINFDPNENAEQVKKIQKRQMRKAEIMNSYKQFTRNKEAQNKISNDVNSSKQVNKSMGELILQLEEYLKKASSTLAELKKADEQLNGKIVCLSRVEQKKFTGYGNSELIKKPGLKQRVQTEVIQSKKQRIDNKIACPAPTKRKISSRTQKNQTKNESKVIFKNHDFEVVQQEDDESTERMDKQEDQQSYQSLQIF